MNKECSIFKLLTTLLGFVTIMSLNGCATSATGELFALTVAIPDKVIIYHYRESSMVGGAYSYDILSNEKPITRLGNGGYFKEVASSGNINYRTFLTSDKGPLLFIDNLITNSYQDLEQAFSFTAEKGKIYFIQWTANTFSSIPEVKIVSKKDALGIISELRAYSPAKPSPKK